MFAHSLVRTLTVKVCVVLSGKITAQDMPELDICVRLERSTQPKEVILFPNAHHGEVIFYTQTDLPEHKKKQGLWLTPYNTNSNRYQRLCHTTSQSSFASIKILRNRVSGIRVPEPKLPFINLI